MKIAIERKFESGKWVIAEITDGKKLTSSLVQEGEVLDFDKTISAVDNKARVEFFAELVELVFKAPSKEEFKVAVSSILRLIVNLDSLYESAFLLSSITLCSDFKNNEAISRRPTVDNIVSGVIECDEYIAWHTAMRRHSRHKYEEIEEAVMKDLPIKELDYEIKCIDGSTFKAKIEKFYERGTDPWLQRLLVKCPNAAEVYHFTNEQTKRIVKILTAEGHWTSKPLA